MPKVSGKKTSKAGTGRKRGGRKAQPPKPPSLTERISGAFHRLVNAVVTYTAVAVVGLVIIVGIMLFAGGYFVNIGDRVSRLSEDMAEAAGLRVKTITWSGATQTREYEVMGALLNDRENLILNKSILHFSPHEAMAKVEALGWVRHAAVSRLYPDTIHVSITERIPAALWQGEGRLHLIDREGVVITEVGAHQYTGLPIIVDTSDPATASDILAILSEYPQLSGRIAELRQRGGRRWDLGFRNGFVVMLPQDNVAEAIHQINIAETKGELSKTMQRLDMRLPNAVYYVPKTQS